MQRKASVNLRIKTGGMIAMDETSSPDHALSTWLVVLGHVVQAMTDQGNLEKPASPSPMTVAFQTEKGGRPYLHTISFNESNELVAKVATWNAMGWEEPKTYFQGPWKQISGRTATEAAHILADRFKSI